MTDVSELERTETWQKHARAGFSTWRSLSSAQSRKRSWDSLLMRWKKNAKFDLCGKKYPRLPCEVWASCHFSMLSGTLFRAAQYIFNLSMIHAETLTVTRFSASNKLSPWLLFWEHTTTLPQTECHQKDGNDLSPTSTVESMSLSSLHVYWLHDFTSMSAWQVKALVEATPISGPAWRYMPASVLSSTSGCGKVYGLVHLLDTNKTSAGHSRAMLEPTTFTTPIVNASASVHYENLA